MSQDDTASAAPTSPDEEFTEGESAESLPDGELTAEGQAGPVSYPTLQVIFDGLFFFCFHPSRDKPGKCKVGVGTHAADHVQLINVDKISAAGTETTTYYLPRDLLRKINYVVVDFENGSPAQATAYQVGEFKRSTHTGNPYDFRWALDFEDEALHKKKLEKKRNVFRPVLVIRGGLFYTSENGIDPNPFAYKKVAGEWPIDFKKYGHVAQTPAMHIYPADPKQRLRMNVCVKFRGVKDEVKYRFTAADGVRYVVRLINVCAPCLARSLYIEDLGELRKRLRELGLPEEILKRLEPATLAQQAPHPGSDIRYYYEAFNLPPGESPLEFVPVIFSPPVYWRGLPPLICYAAQGSKSAHLPHDDDDELEEM